MEFDQPLVKFDMLIVSLSVWLHRYTIGLLVLIALLALPVPIAILRGFTKSEEHGFRWRQTLDKFWGYVM